MTAIGDRPAASPLPERTAWPAVALLVATGVMAAAQLGKVPPLVAALQADLGVSLVTVGWAMSVITLVSAVLGLAAGGLLGATEMKRALLAALAVTAAGSMLGALAGGAPALLVARTVEGAGYLVVTVACPALVAFNASDRGRPLALALWGCFVPAGLALANLAAPALAALRPEAAEGWRLVFWAGAAAVAAMAVLIAVTPMRQPAPAGAGPARDRRAGGGAGADPPAGVVARAVIADLRLALAHPPALLIAGAFFWFAGLHVGFLAVLPAFLITEAGLSPAAAGQVAAASALAYIPGSLAAGWAMRRGLSPAGLGIGGYAALAVSAAAVLAGVLPVPAAAVAAIALSVAAGVSGAVLFAGAPGCAPSPDRVRLVLGLFAQGGSLGVLLMPPALAWIAQAADWAATLPVFAFGATLAGAALFSIRRPLATARG